MPVYQYTDKRTGKLVELYRTVELRDNVSANLVRVTVPTRIGIAGTSSSPLDPATAAVQVPNAYKQMEEKVPAHEIVRESGFSIDQVKRIWGM